MHVMTPGSRALRFGLMYLQAAPWDDVMERVRRGEQMGFDSLWVADHMTGQYPKLIAFEAWTLLGAVALATTRARIGTLVTPITFRHPSLLAMSATTVAFTDYVGRYREVGVDEFVFYWPFDQETFARVPRYEAALERIASDVIPALRTASPDRP